MIAAPLHKRPAEPQHTMYGYSGVTEALMIVSALLFSVNIMFALGFFVVAQAVNALIRAKYVHGTVLAGIWINRMWDIFAKKPATPFWPGRKNERVFFS